MRRVVVITDSDSDCLARARICIICLLVCACTPADPNLILGQLGHVLFMSDFHCALDTMEASNNSSHQFRVVQAVHITNLCSKLMHCCLPAVDN